MESNPRPPRRSRKRFWWAFGLVALPLILYILMRRATSLRPREIPLRQDVRIVTNLAYSPDGKFLGFETDTTRSGVLSWIDAQSGQPVDPKGAVCAGLNAIRLQHALPQSPRITVSVQGATEARDTETQHLLWATTPHIGVYAPTLQSFEFVADGNYLVAQDNENGSWLLDAYSGKVLYRWSSGYGDRIYGSQKLNSGASRQPNYNIVYSVHDLSVEPHSFVVTEKYRVGLYNLAAGKMLKTFNFPLPQRANLFPLVEDEALSLDRRTLANIVILHDSTRITEMRAYLWHFQQGSPQVLDGDFAPPKSKGAKKLVPPDYMDSVSSNLLFSPDGRYLAASGSVITDSTSANMTCVWDGAIGRLLHAWRGTGGKLVFSQDSQLLASTSDTKVSVWEVKTGRNVRSVPFKRTDESDFALAPDGQTLATAEPSHHIIKLWPLAR